MALHAIAASMFSRTFRMLSALVAGERDRRRAAAAPFVSSGLTLLSIVWASALGTWFLVGQISPMLAVAVGSPLVRTQSLPQLGAADATGARIEELIRLAARGNGTSLAAASAGLPALGMPPVARGLIFVLLPWALLAVTHLTSSDSVLATLPAAALGAATALSGAVTATAGGDPAYAYSRSVWVYYKHLSSFAGTLRAAGGGRPTNTAVGQRIAEAMTLARAWAERVAMADAASAQASVQRAAAAAWLPPPLLLWAAPLLLAAAVAAVAGAAATRAAGRLSMHAHADRAHLLARLAEDEDAARVSAAELGTAAPRAGSDPGVVVRTGWAGALLRRLVRGLCCRGCGAGVPRGAANATPGRAGRTGAVPAPHGGLDIAIGPGWDRLGRFHAVAQAERADGSHPPDPVAVRDRWLRLRRRRAAAPSRGGEDPDGGEGVRRRGGGEGGGAAGASARGSAGIDDDDDETAVADDGGAPPGQRGYGTITPVEVLIQGMSGAELLWWRSVEALPDDAIAALAAAAAADHPTAAAGAADDVGSVGSFQ